MSILHVIYVYIISPTSVQYEKPTLISIDLGYVVPSFGPTSWYIF